jgi:hypothetical protein
MKKILSLLIISLIVSIAISAQESSSKVKELGTYTAGFNSFGIRYKSGTDKSLFRLSISPFSAFLKKEKSNSESTDHYNNYEFGFNLGFEKRKSLYPNLSFCIGSDFLNSLSYYNSQNEGSDYKSNNWSLSTGIGLVLGFNYKINEVICLSAEAVPSILYVYSHSKTNYGSTENISKGSGVDFGFHGSDINLSILFILGKKN